MSYPSIGMPGIIPNNEWTPANIETLLRNGAYIFDDHTTNGCSKFNPTTGTFEYSFSYYAVVAGHSVPQEKTETRSFATFLELACFLAFFGQDFL